FAAAQAPEERKTQILLRAYYWLQQALPQLEGNAQRDVEKRMLEIMERVPPEYRVGEIVEEYRRYEGNTGPIYGVAFSPDGHKAYLRSVAFSRDSKYLVSGGDDRMVRLWDVDKGEEIKAFAGHSHFVWSVAFAPDTRHVLSGGLDKTVRLWDIGTGKELKEFKHKDTVMSVAVSPDGRRALSGST